MTDIPVVRSRAIQALVQLDFAKLKCVTDLSKTGYTYRGLKALFDGQAEVSLSPSLARVLCSLRKTVTALGLLAQKNMILPLSHEKVKKGWVRIPKPWQTPTQGTIVSFKSVNELRDVIPRLKAQNMELLADCIGSESIVSDDLGVGIRDRLLLQTSDLPRALQQTDDQQVKAQHYCLATNFLETRQMELMEVVEQGNIEQLEQFWLMHKAEFQPGDFDDDSAMLRAASCGNLHICKKLVALGFAVETPPRSDETLLQMASLGGNPEVVQWLLDKHVDLDDGAINYCDDIDVMRLLLKNGAKMTDTAAVTIVNFLVMDFEASRDLLQLEDVRAFLHDKKAKMLALAKAFGATSQSPIWKALDQLDSDLVASLQK